MNVGDLVQKVTGYGSEHGWIALLLGFRFSEDHDYLKVIVLHDGEVDEWLAHTIEPVVH
mgnify:FL=1